MKTRMGLVALATAAMLSLSGNAMALTKRTFCVFDIIGANGDTFNIMRDYKTAAVEWGVDVELKPYPDEKIASEDLKAGQCDAAVLTGIRGRQFNSYTGSMDSIGAIPSYDAMRTVISQSSPIPHHAAESRSSAPAIRKKPPPPARPDALAPSGQGNCPSVIGQDRPAPNLKYHAQTPPPHLPSQEISAWSGSLPTAGDS